MGQVAQVVARPAGTHCSLSVDWEFIANEPLSSTSNDFLSIDVINNTTNVLISNVVFIYVGTSAGAPAYHNVPGGSFGLTWIPNPTDAVGIAVQAPAGFKRAWVDLSAVPVGTPMRIEISVGNEGSAFTGDSTAFVDNMRLSVGQVNASPACLRVLGSSHADGIGDSTDWGGDFRPEAPYLFQAAPGQRLSFRARSTNFGVPWILVAGALLDPGVTTPYGILNIDVGQPYSFLIDGTSPNPLSQYLGTISAPASFYEAQVPVSTPLGTTITVQAAMLDPAAPAGFTLTAATTIEVGSPNIPMGTTLAGSAGVGANADDGFTQITFSPFPSWPFYGSARTSVFVGSNGFLTFGSGSTDLSETETEMLTGPARIAACWDDLAPNMGGAVMTSQTATTFTASWAGVPEFANPDIGNNFSIQLYQAVSGGAPAGVFTIYFGSSTLEDGLCGISPGGLAAPAPGTVSSQDLSTTVFSLGSHGNIASNAPFFQRFAQSDIGGLLMDKFDLMTLGAGVSRITFVPNGTGYSIITGAR